MLGEIVQSLLETLEVDAERICDVESLVYRQIDGLKNVIHLRERHSPAEMRKQIAEVGRIANKLKTKISAMHESIRPLFESEVDRILLKAEAWAPPNPADDGGLQVPKGSPHLDPVALKAADFAYDLVSLHAKNSPTMTQDGCFLSVAQLLVECATGDREVNIERACGQVLKERRAKQDQIADARR